MPSSTLSSLFRQSSEDPFPLGENWTLSPSSSTFIEPLHFIQLHTLEVIKRNGKIVKANPQKITDRIRKLTYGLDHTIIKPEEITQAVIKRWGNRMTVSEIDEIAAKVCEASGIAHPDFRVLASRIECSNLHKSTPKKFSDAMRILSEYTMDGEPAPLVGPKYVQIWTPHFDQLDNEIIHENDVKYLNLYAK